MDVIWQYNCLFYFFYFYKKCSMSVISLVKRWGGSHLVIGDHMLLTLRCYFCCEKDFKFVTDKMSRENIKVWIGKKRQLEARYISHLKIQYVNHSPPPSLHPGSLKRIDILHICLENKHNSMIFFSFFSFSPLVRG